MGRPRLAVTLLATLGLMTPALGSTPPEVPPQASIAPDAIADFDAFGASVALDGETAVVGAQGIDQGGFNRGGGWVLAANGSSWTPTTAIIPALAEPSDEFGAAVAVAEGFAFLGSFDQSAGSVDAPPFVAVFEAAVGTWSEVSPITIDLPLDSGFGSAIDADQDLVVIGAPLLDLEIRDEGGAFIYRRVGTSFTLEASLVAPDAFENDRFGFAVAVSGDRVVVGAPRDDDAGIDGGAAWVFELVDGTWTATSKIVRTERDWYAGFGSAVDIDGDLLAIGAPRDDLGGLDDGAVRTYQRLDETTWALEAAIVGDDDGSWGREVGDAVSLDGERLVIGAPADPRMGSNAGAAFTWIRENGSWRPESQIRSEEVTGLALLGAAVGASDGRVLIGVPVTSAFGQYAGGVASLDLRSDCDTDGMPDYIAVTAGVVADCNLNGQPDACDLEQGLDTDCNGNGIPDECDLADGSELDCDDDGVLDSCQIDAGSASDCNDNGLIDDCEIEAGTAGDCDGNGVIDQCELDAGTTEDCNLNGTIDSCEIADGTAADLDRDGVVDTCQSGLVFLVPERFTGIAKAIGIAPEGSTISIAAGTYSDAIDFQGKAIVIEGNPADPASVVIDGQGLDSAVVLAVSEEGPGSILRGVTIRGGTSGSDFKAIGAMVGGGMYTYETSPLVEDCIFESNSAEYGGAVYARRGSPVFRRCVFLGNEAEVDGGGFQFSRTEGGLLEACTFLDNEAGNNGGGIHLFDGTPFVLDTMLIGNTALSGGGISWAGFGGQAFLTGSTIEGNTASEGAGVMITQPTTDLVVSATTVCENAPDQLVGTYVDGGGNTICPNVDCNLNGLEDADEIADGLAQDCNLNDVIDACEIADGSQPDVNRDQVLDSCQDVLTFEVPSLFASITEAIETAPEGSIVLLAPGIYNEAVDFGTRNLVLQGDPADPTRVILSGVGLDTSVISITGGQDESSMLVGVQVQDGSIGSPLPGQPTSRIGGGIFIQGSSPIIQDCIFRSNTSGFGGGMYVLGGAPTIRFCEFLENLATSDGGAFFAFNSETTIRQCTMSSNQAVNQGGGLKVVFGRLQVLETQLTGNTASQGGGLFWFADEDSLPLQISGCTISGNAAKDSGGGIKSRPGYPGVLLLDTTVCGNTPDEIDGEYIDDSGNTLCVCPADLSGDGVVSGADLGILLVSFGTCTTGVPCPADLSGDGEVTGADLGLFLVGWGACP